MKLMLSIPLLSLLFAPSMVRGPQVTSQWQRVITPAMKDPMAAQCVVLDADLFAHAAPGLRDVRLLQDGQELPYAMDESHDDAGEAAEDDRAFYEPSLLIPADADKQGWFGGRGLLPARVPVERVRVEPAGVATLRLRAAPEHDLPSAETLNASLTEKRSAVLFTIGANLQEGADIEVAAHADDAPVRKFVLEMRRRELCYQPVSASPVMMLFGDDKAQPVHYAFARTYRPVAVPLLSVLGPRGTNPEFRETLLHPFALNRVQRLLVLYCAGAAVLLLLVAPMLRLRR